MYVKRRSNIKCITTENDDIKDENSNSADKTNALLLTVHTSASTGNILIKHINKDNGSEEDVEDFVELLDDDVENNLINNSNNEVEWDELSTDV